VTTTTESIVGAVGEPVTDPDGWLARLREIAAAAGFRVQAIDADAVCCRVHLESALLHAHRAFDRGRQFAKSLEVEWVLCVAGVRQIGAAIERVGIREGTERFALLFIAEGHLDGKTVDALMEDLGLATDERVLKCTEGALERLGVGVEEREAVPRERWSELAMERTAMLDLER
jgi:KEOPS complex subunit Cgi121